MGRTVRAILAAPLLLVACGDDDAAEPPVTTASVTTTAEATTTTTAPPDPSVIPDDPADIDEAYVEAVLAELMHLDGEVLREAMTVGPSPATRQQLEAIYTTEQAADQAVGLAQLAASGYPGVLVPPGDVEMRVERVLIASATCVAVEVNEDFAAVATAPPPRAPSRVELVPWGDSSGPNPTAWMISVRFPLEGELGPGEPCVTA